MIKGTYIFKENGKEICRSSNVVTKFGKRFLTNYIAGNVSFASKDIAIGIDSTAASVNDTRLGFEFYRLPVELNSTDIQTSGGTSTYSVVYKTTLPVDIAGVISEIGIYPTTRTSIVNFDSKFIADFNSYLDWYDAAGAHPDMIATNAKIGSNLMQFSSNGTSAQEYTTNLSNLDISGYSINDTFKLAYYKDNANLQSITIKFYTTDSDYYTLPIPSQSGTGYKLSEDITLDNLSVGAGTPDKTSINKIGVVITPTSGNSTSVGMDGFRVNDEDTFDPIFGIISRSVLSTALTKVAGRQVDIEYRLDLDF